MWTGLTESWLTALSSQAIAAEGSAVRTAYVASARATYETRCARGVSPAISRIRASPRSDRSSSPSCAAATTIPAHADALRILLRNLLENAIRHAREGGRVDVEVRRGAGAVVLAVSDDGPGIPPAERARVLDRFYRVAGTGSTGSGLGLAIVKSIADLHGARLALEDSPTLGGLRVVVDFPEDGRPA